MNSKQKIHQNKLQLLATKVALKNRENSLPSVLNDSQNLESLDLTSKIADFNSQNENSNIKFIFDQNIIPNPDSNSFPNLENLLKKLQELQNDKQKLQSEIQNLESKIQNQDKNQTLLEQKIARQNWQNWQINKENRELSAKFQRSQSDKLEILKQRVFWQKKAKEKSESLHNVEKKIEELELQIKDLDEQNTRLEDQNQIWQEKWTKKTQKTFRQKKLWGQNTQKIQREFILQIKEIEKKLFERERIWLISLVLLFGMLISLSFYILKT